MTSNEDSMTMGNKKKLPTSLEMKDEDLYSELEKLAFIIFITFATKHGVFVTNVTTYYALHTKTVLFRGVKYVHETTSPSLIPFFLENHRTSCLPLLLRCACILLPGLTVVEEL